MSLTCLIDDLNVRLPALHPHTRLHQQAGYRLDHGKLTAEVAGFLLTPYLVPVVHAATGERFGQRGRLWVRTRDGLPVTPETLYVQAWDAEDVVYLDRFLRTLQALNHVHQGHDGREPLVLDVHLRHVAALSAHHGAVFETLLDLLGLRPTQVVLRLDGRALHGDVHVQQAARSFAGHGYQLLASRPDIDDTDWDLMGSLGVRWVSPHHRYLEAWPSRRPWGRWRQAKTGRIGLWFDGIDSPEAFRRARALGADLIEGDLVLPARFQATSGPIGTLRKSQ
jgi:EAL domain-containing protein (putative c-di-GMP-specific phosphodiesterase class I)